MIRSLTLRLDLWWTFTKRRLIRKWGYIRPYSRAAQTKRRARA